MGVWSRVAVPGAPGRYRVFEDGVEVGDIVLEHSLAVTLSARMVAALNVDESLVRVPDPFVVVGWVSRSEHDAELDLVRVVTTSEPVEVRDRVSEAWVRRREGCDGSVPMSRPEMLEWIEAVDLIVSTFHAQAVVPDVAA